MNCPLFGLNLPFAPLTTFSACNLERNVLTLYNFNNWAYHDHLSAIAMRESEREGDCEERENRAENRRRRKGSRVGVESKVFEIEVEERKGKPQAIIVERKRGISSWVRLGPVSLGIFLESLNQYIKEEKAGK